MVVTLWWMSFWTAVGLCLGSFLNAVIYRLPRDRSLKDPLWSFCPACRHRIKWFDNIPVLSFVLLRGRCRHCGVPISTRYPVIEMAMALIVLMLMDAFFIGQVRQGLSESSFGLTDRLATDWPIFLAHIILFACLLSMSAIDLEHYWVDIRFTNLATAVGFVCHALWTPAHSNDWIRPSDATAVMSLFALIALGLTWLVAVCRPALDEPPGDDGLGDPPTEMDEGPSYSNKPPPSLKSGPRAAGWITGVLLIGTFLALLLDEAGVADLRHAGRAALPLIMLFVLIVRESTQTRPADHDIVEAIHNERHTARGMVLQEFVTFIPTILGAALALWLFWNVAGFQESMSKGLHLSARFDQIAMMRNWSPLYGIATAASGYIIAGAVGWCVRIVFTLAFGKEAFGTGDIHLMAAAGAVMGWPAVVFGFLLTCALALLGWIVMLPFKRSRALPLGPWLSLALLTVALFYDSILSFPVVERFVDAFSLLFLR